MFLTKARETGLAVTGPMLRTLAEREAKKLGLSDFQASEGWLDRMKKRHGISGCMLCGEAATADNFVVQSYSQLRDERHIQL